ncbi:hypothetical protein [Cohnella sp. 56]|uniref:hypothetical protein n=1 Tax=Cohnella sp. 56 TaxID=3113722 RepID=UPI0030E81489
MVKRHEDIQGGKTPGKGGGKPVGRIGGNTGGRVSGNTGDRIGGSTDDRIGGNTGGRVSGNTGDRIGGSRDDRIGGNTGGTLSGNTGVNLSSHASGTSVANPSSIVAAFIERQRSSAKGQRLEMLNRDLSGTIKLLTDILLPVFGTLEGFHLEYEIVSATGVKLYADIYYEPLGLVFECDGYVPHVELMTRDRFSFERMRMRSFALIGYKYVPFSRDEMDKKPEMCKRAVYELLGRYGSGGDQLLGLPVYMREVVRNAASGASFTQREAREWLLLQQDKTRSVLRDMLKEGWIELVGGSEKRNHHYRLGVKGRGLLGGNVLIKR